MANMMDVQSSSSPAAALDHASPLFKPHMSITLPRNFAPSGLDGMTDPRTPDQTPMELNLPPPPPHSTLRIRRPRLNLTSFQTRNITLPATLFASEVPAPSSAVTAQPDSDLLDPFSPDVPLPSVEPSNTLGRPLFLHSQTEPSPSDRLRLPSYRDQLPRTPPAQTRNTPTELKRSVWDLHRSESEYSLGSDCSSLSSSATFTTRPTSFDGSTTSPDLDLADPFSPSKVNIIPDTPTRRSKKMKMYQGLSKERVQWSIEMDNHLFNVYQIYLADPSVTPFKTVPGSIPPTGVCHRVARRAKETWPKASRIQRPIVRRYKLRNVFEDRAVARDKTPDPNDFLKTDTPTEQRDAWPSESATRKRLKQLCKEKFTITAHYQRLRESRSPSPFTDQFLKRPTSRLTRSTSSQLPESSATTYTTRELGISLVASGATAPLAQLVTGDSPQQEQQADDWFNTPVNSSSDQMNISPPSGLGIQAAAPDVDRLNVVNNIPRLASPFTYSTWNGSSQHSQHRRHLSQNIFDTMHVTGSRLLSPFRPEQDVSSNIHKRRAQHNLEDELSPRGSNLGLANIDAGESSKTQEFILSGNGDLSNRRIRLRNRGATLGAVNSREQIQRLFSPPTLQTTAPNVPAVPALPPSLTALASSSNSNASLTDASFSQQDRTPTSLMPPSPDAAQKRLGSPFELDPNKRSQRAHAPRHVPSLSDPFVSTSSLSISERLAEFSALQRQRSDDPFI